MYNELPLIPQRVREYPTLREFDVPEADIVSAEPLPIATAMLMEKSSCHTATLYKRSCSRHMMHYRKTLSVPWNSARLT